MNRFVGAAAVITAFALVGLTACGDITKPSAADQSAINQDTIQGACENSIKNQLKDPDSAKFSNWNINWHPTAQPPADLGFKTGDQYVIAIATVNAKNSFGGYDGPQVFGGDALLHSNGDADCIAKIVDVNSDNTDTPDAGTGGN